MRGIMTEHNYIKKHNSWNYGLYQLLEMPKVKLIRIVVTFMSKNKKRLSILMVCYSTQTKTKNWVLDIISTFQPAVSGAANNDSTRNTLLHNRHIIPLDCFHCSKTLSTSGKAGTADISFKKLVLDWHRRGTCCEVAPGTYRWWLVSLMKGLWSRGRHQQASPRCWHSQVHLPELSTTLQSGKRSSTRRRDRLLVESPMSHHRPTRKCRVPSSISHNYFASTPAWWHGLNLRCRWRFCTPHPSVGFTPVNFLWKKSPFLFPQKNLKPMIQASVFGLA